MKREIISSIVVFVFFSLEAFIHYSIGKSSERRGGHGRIKFILPGWRDAMKILLVVLIFSLLTFATNLAIDNIFLKEEG